MNTVGWGSSPAPTSTSADTSPLPPPHQTVIWSLALGQQGRAGRQAKPASSAGAREATRNAQERATPPWRTPAWQLGELLGRVPVQQVVREQLQQQDGVVGCEAVAAGVADAPRALALGDERLDT